jgi:predicted nucleotide-binding protein
LISESLKVIDISAKIHETKNTDSKNKEDAEDGSLTIFIGSSKEAIPDMERVGLLLEELGHKHLLWTNAGEFVAGDTTLESIVDISDRVDGAIFIFNAEDETWYRDSKVPTVRDNVLIEYGIFVGAKGRKNSIFACKNKPKIPTDLLGINYMDLAQGELTLKTRLRAWLEKIS